MFGLYLHIPFCSSICNYCNFNRGLFEAGLKDRYVDGARAGDPPRGPRRGGRHDLLRRRHAVAARTGGDRAAGRGLSRRLRPGARRRDHARDQSRDRRRRPDGAVPRGRRQSHQFRRPVLQSRGTRRGSGGSTRRTGPARAVARGARGRVRQRQPGPDDVAAAADGWPTGRRASRRSIEVGPGARVALPARALSERAAQGRHGARGLVAGARRRRGGRCICGVWSGWSRRVTAVPDFQRRPARPGVAPQPQVLDRRRVARVRVRRALHPRRRAVEERRPPPRTTWREFGTTRRWRSIGGCCRRRSGWRRRCSPASALSRASTSRRFGRDTAWIV